MKSMKLIGHFFFMIAMLTSTIADDRIPIVHTTDPLGLKSPDQHNVPTRVTFPYRRSPRQIQSRTDQQYTRKYNLTKEDLEKIRTEKLYPFGDEDIDGQPSDLLIHDRSYTNQVMKQLNFSLPFFGFTCNYTWVSVHGYIGFRDAAFPSASVQFPVPSWPKDKDPSFIGPLYAHGRIGKSRGNDTDQIKPGVYFRVERDLTERSDEMGVKIAKRTLLDIRDAIVGAQSFTPKHVIIITWKNIVSGWIPSSENKSNTFQVVIATDENRTYAIFNYDQLDSTTNAFVGFNAGGGRKAYEYKPYSRDSEQIKYLLHKGYANQFPGRHVFRIDEIVTSGNCYNDASNGFNQPLVFAPTSAPMMGGTTIYVTGPCFSPEQDIVCRFDTQAAVGRYINQNKAACIMPLVDTTGYVDLALSINNGADFSWKGLFFVETDWFESTHYYQLNSSHFRVNWHKKNFDQGARIRVSLWGVSGDTQHPKLEFIDVLQEDAVNNGTLTVWSSDFINRDNGPHLQKYIFGLIQINLTTYDPKIRIGPSVWTLPISLGWYFNQQWQRAIGDDVLHQRCQDWMKLEYVMRRFTIDSPVCPCVIQQAASNKGLYFPIIDCSYDSHALCQYNRNLSTCYHAGFPSKLGDSQHCCYGYNGLLMTSSRGNPTYLLSRGIKQPFSKDKIVLSETEIHQVDTQVFGVFYRQMDIVPYYTCCTWQSHDVDNKDCKRFITSQQASQVDCLGYQSPGIAAVFGDLHFYTFDNLAYSFNGKGEFVLVRADSDRIKLDVQARFEAVPDAVGRATHLTAVVAQEKDSAVVEVQIRPQFSQSKYRSDILVDQNRVYFDTHNYQHFKGVMVYTPKPIANQSHVIVMFHSGVGIEVVENNRHMTARVYLPSSHMYQTRGLFGNWSNDVTDDFVRPDGTPGPSIDINKLESLHQSFGIKWLLNEKADPYKGKSLFHHENNLSSKFNNDETFHPLFDTKPLLQNNSNYVNQTELEQTCGTSYQCYYDFSISLSLQHGRYAKYYLEEILQLKQDATDCNFDNLCLNGGICRNLIDSFECSCPPGYSGLLCEEKLDLIPMYSFKSTSLVDGSTRKEPTTNELDELAEKVSSMVDNALTDPKITNELFYNLSNLLEVDEEMLGSSTKANFLIIDSIDRYTRQVPLKLDQPVVMVTPNIAVETVLVSAKRDSYIFQPSFDGYVSDNIVSMTVPKEAFLASGGDVRLRFVSYKNSKLFQSQTNRLPGQPTIVLSVTVGDHSVLGLMERLTYTIPMSNSSSFYSCVFWDEADKEWSTRGVETRVKNSETIECLSDHLTAFSVLLDPTPAVRLSGFHETVLTIISYIGISLSIIGLSITVFLYGFIRNLRRDRAGKIHLNLSVSLLMLDLVFLTGSIMGQTFTNVDRDDIDLFLDRIWVAPEPASSRARVNFCTGLTISVHYLVLTSLSWMLVEAIHMYQMLILVFTSTETKFILKRMVAAWGGPLIIVITTAALHPDHYQDPSGETCGQMSEVHPIIYYGAFFGPVCFILLVNSAVFVMVLRVILRQGQRGRAVGKVSTENASVNYGTDRSMMIGQLRGAVTLMALLGVTWVAGALAIGPLKVFMSYVFCICNSLQGFVIFIVRVVQYPEARKSFTTLWSTNVTSLSRSTTKHSSEPSSNSSGTTALRRDSKKALRARKMTTAPKSSRSSENRSEPLSEKNVASISNQSAPPVEGSSLLSNPKALQEDLKSNTAVEEMISLLPMVTESIPEVDPPVRPSSAHGVIGTYANDIDNFTSSIALASEDVRDQSVRESLWVLYF